MRGICASGRVWRIAVVALLLLVGPLGCGPAGKEVAKKITKKVLIEAAGQATVYVGEEVLHQQRLRHADDLRSYQPGQRVQDMHNARAYQYNNAEVQLRVIPNLYSGWNYYTLDGQPVAFSVPELTYTPYGVQWTGRYYYYTPNGHLL